MKRWAWIQAAVLVGCAGPVGDPRIEAHRGGASYWPQNSRAAVQGAVAADFDGIEVDLALTLDGEAVLSRDPWLDPERCTDAEGDPLPERVRIDEVHSTVLRREYLCGGLPDPDFANAEVLAEPLLSFDEMLELLGGASAGLRVHVDLQVERGWTPPAEDWLEPVLDRYWAADLPQTLVVSANTPEAVRAFEDHAREADRDLWTLRIYPRAEPGASAVSVGLAAERDSLLGRVDYVGLIEEAGADGIAVNHEIAELGKLEAVQDAGYEAALWTVNGADSMRRYSRWPVDTLISDTPGARP